MFVRFQSVRAGRNPFQVLAKHFMPEASGLQPVFLTGKRADAIRTFVKAYGFIVHS